MLAQRRMFVFCQAGFHIQLLLSYYTVNWPLILYSLCMVIAVSYCYGQKRYISDLCSLSSTKLQETTMTHLVVLFTTVVPVFLVVSHKYCALLWFKFRFSINFFFNPYISLFIFLFHSGISLNLILGSTINVGGI